MPTRIPNISVTLHREGKRIEVKPGKPFNFTKEEINDLTALVPHALRKPVNETPVNQNEGDEGGTGGDTGGVGGVGGEGTTTTVKAATGSKAEKANSKTKAKEEKAAVKEEGSDGSDDGEGDL